MDSDLKSFLKELTELTEKYNIYLGGSPFLYDEKDTVLIRNLVHEKGKGYHQWY